LFADRLQWVKDELKERPNDPWLKHQAKRLEEEQPE
jgi:hypothetical protein